MNWSVGWQPPQRKFIPLNSSPPGTWEPILRLGKWPTIKRLQNVYENESNLQSTRSTESSLVGYSQPASISRARFSVDGRYIAAVDVRGGLQTYDVLTGENIYEFNRSENGFALNDLTWSSDKNGGVVFTASSDGSCKIFSLKNIKNKPILSIENAHNGSCTAVAIEKLQRGGGTTFMTGGRDGIMNCWDLRNTVEPLEKVKAHQGSINSMEVSNDDTVVSTASSDGFARFWRTKNLRILSTVIAKELKPCHHAIFSPNDAFLLCGTADWEIRCWHVHRQSRGLLKNEGILTDSVSISSKFCKDEYINLVPFQIDKQNDNKNTHELNISDEQKKTLEWEAYASAARQSRQEAISITNELMLKRLAARHQRLHFYQDKENAAKVFADSTPKSWLGQNSISLKTPHETTSHTCLNYGHSEMTIEKAKPHSTACFWRDRAVVGCADGCLHIWDAATGVHEQRLPHWHNYNSLITSVDTHPDLNTGIISSSATRPDSSLILWMYVSSEDFDYLGID